MSGRPRSVGGHEPATARVSHTFVRSQSIHRDLRPVDRLLFCVEITREKMYPLVKSGENECM